MSVSKRRCGTCRYFQDAGMAGNGWCTHPKRQLSSDVRILVRTGELACRNSWGNDFWEDREETGLPAAASAPPSPPVDQPIATQASFDDEVTSVVASDGTSSSRADHNDVVVEQTSLLPDEPSSVSHHRYRASELNEPAHQEQEERVDLMRRGSRDAILRARERHRLRRGQPVDGAEGNDPDDEDDPSDSVPAHKSSFAPEDYVEDEGPTRHADANEPEDHEGDVLLREGTPSSLRVRRLRRAHLDRQEPIRERASDPAPPPAPAPAPSDRTATRSIDDARFTTIPEIREEIELPRLKRHQPARPTPVAAEPEQESNEDASPYNEVLKRAQAIKAAARVEREARHQEARRPISVPLRRAPEHRPEPEPVEEPETEWHDPIEKPFQMNDVAGEPVRAQEAPAVSSPLLGNPGIRFHRRQPAPDVYPDEETHDEPAAYEDADEAVLPEPVARRRWWRGLLPGRARGTQASHRAVDEYDWIDDEHDEAYGTEDDNRWEPADTQVSSQDAWSEDESEPDIWAQPEPAPLVTTSDEAFVEDAQTFVGRRYTTAPWLDDADGKSADDASTGVDPVPQTHEPQQPYRPLDLENSQGLDAFRSRLFVERDDPPESRASSLPPRHEAPSVPAWHEEEDRPVRTAARVQPEELLENPSDAWYEPELDPDFDIRAVVEQQNDLIDMAPQVSPDVPRMCATCRSYRSAEQGERGWCTNNWAFTHRQMVNADDLACQSTIGCWWLPADNAVWLDDHDAEVSEPTPRVERLIAHLQPLRRTAER